MCVKGNSYPFFPDCGASPQHRGPTFLTVGLPIFHVEEAVPEGLLAGCTDKAGGVPRLSQGMHHFLGKRASAQDRKVQEEKKAGLTSTPAPVTAGASHQGAGQESPRSGPWTRRRRLGAAEERLLLVQHLLGARFCVCFHKL